MDLKAEVEKWIKQLRLKWILLYLIQGAVISLGITLVLGMVLIRYTTFSEKVFIPTWASLGILLLLFKPVWKITVRDMASYLDAKFVLVEESTSLFLKPIQEITLLEQLQIERIGKLFPLRGSLNTPLRKTSWALVFMGCCLFFSFLIHQLAVGRDFKSSITTALPKTKENTLPAIATYEVNINPPNYTKKAARKQQQFLVRAETGALVNWKIQSNIPLKNFAFIFNDTELHQLQPLNAARTQWGFSKIISQPGFYQLVLDDKKSDLYAIEVIPDLPVQIKIINPKQNTTIDVGQVPKTALNLILTDDYGINDAFVTATMASGKGEGVSFTEKKLLFNTRFNNKTEIKLQKTIDLNTLGMKPGDELYFFVTAKDNQGQISRSDVCFVTLVDPSELMSMAAVTNGVSLVPEYFRSQRQLIIDTEQLLKEEKRLSVSEFKNRSNELGVDQKLLRLRYGQFLGEEAETGIGEADGHDEGAPATDKVKFGDAQAIADRYAHQHDIAEDATYFEPEIKARLKAVLTEMWNAELRLRTYKPQDALPFEYKALRLLKDLQQKSRAYVAKTTLKTTRLKADKRLTGDLDKIATTKQQVNSEQKDNVAVQLKLTLALLEARKSGKAFDVIGLQLLHEAEKQLILAAADKPEVYLAALKSMRTIATSLKVNLAAIEQVQQALQTILGTVMAQPGQQVQSLAKDLYQPYFNALKKTSN
ncbi:MAG: hypothetical protein V4541_09630 [Bacteroidota bacterium]